MTNPLARWLEATDTTHEAFARLAGVDRSTVTRWAARGPRTIDAVALIDRLTRGAVPVSAWVTPTVTRKRQRSVTAGDAA